ncbi:MAG: alpha/beta hydrolase [Pusillimonas sp.]
MFHPTAALWESGEAWATRHVETARGVISVRDFGHGPTTFVLLHGISSGSGSWLRCARHLADYGRVIAWDAPGYGDSSPLPDPAPLATSYGASLHALVDALELETFFLTGHSLGALMAAGYSSLPQARAFGYALFSPALGYGGRDKAAAIRQGRFNALAQKGIEGIATALPDRLLSAQASPAQRQAVIDNALRLNAGGYRQAVELLSADDINRYTTLVASNTRVFCGDADIVTTPEQSRTYAQTHGMPFDLVCDAGHACYIEQPGQVASMILSASADLRRAHEAQ